MKDSPNDKPNLLDTSDSNDNIDQPRNSMLFSSGGKSQPSSKQERTSSPEQSFKVTCPQKSEVLSTICDNIYEDVGTNININSTLMRTKSDEDLHDMINENENKEKIEIPVKEVKNNKDDEKEEEDDFLPKKTRPHKKSFIFKNIININRLNCPRPLEDQWNYEKILLDYNIIDFTSKKILNIIFLNSDW
jgi:hypothetical protein